MKYVKPAAATAVALTMAAQAVQAGNMAEPMMEEAVIVEEAASSSAGGIIIPLLFLLLLAAAIGSGGDSVPTEA